MIIMLEKFSTIATVTKIRAMNGNMLTESNYRELLNKQSVGEIASYLKKNTRYRSILSTVDTNTVHRGHLEMLIRKFNFDEFVRLCMFQQLDKISFYNYEVKKEEIEQILSCILHLNARKSEDYILTLPSYLIEHASFDMIALAKSKSYSDLLKVIKHTSYWKILKDIKPDGNEQIDYLRCEVLLRTYYYQNMFKVIDEDFSGKVAEHLKKEINVQIDLINVINSYRLKSYFKADEAEIKVKMLPFYGSISRKQMYKFYEAKDKEQMLELFKKTMYASKLKTFDESVAEQNVFKIRYMSARRALKTARSAPIALYSFRYLCEVEAMNVISIVEGIRYKASPSYIEKLLII